MPHILDSVSYYEKKAGHAWKLVLFVRLKLAFAKECEIYVSPHPGLVALTTR